MAAKHVLFIEPDSTLAAAYAAALTQQGYHVAFAKSAQQAIAAADRQLPDVVVLELQMARHNGVEFMYEFKSYTEWQDIPIVILSALSTRELAGYRDVAEKLHIARVLKKSETTAVQLAKELDAVCSVEPS